MPALRWAWVSEVATGEIVTDPALFDSLDPEGSLEPNGSLGYLALTSNRQLYVYNATSGALLYAHEIPGRGLLPPTSRANIVPLNFKGLAVFPTANGESLGIGLCGGAGVRCVQRAWLRAVTGRGAHGRRRSVSWETTPGSARESASKRVAYIMHKNVWYW